jgi:hypothetical protein
VHSRMRITVWRVREFYSRSPYALGLFSRGANGLWRSAAPRARPVGICGEHGGEPNSVQFCYRVGMDYVSCSPYRAPIAAATRPKRCRRRKAAIPLQLERKVATVSLKTSQLFKKTALIGAVSLFLPAKNRRDFPSDCSIA